MSEPFRSRVADRHRFERPPLEFDPMLLLSTLVVGVLLTALLVPAQFWSGVS
jgi:hypothetical protein